MADITGALSSSHFCPTNIKVLSLPFTEYPFLLPSHAANTFLIGFMFKLISLHKNITDIICKRDGEDAKSLAEIISLTNVYIALL